MEISGCHIRDHTVGSAVRFMMGLVDLVVGGINVAMRGIMHGIVVS